MLGGQGRQLRAVARQYLFIGGDYGLASFERFRDEPSRGLDAAHQLDDDVDVRVFHHGRRIRRPHVGGNGDVPRLVDVPHGNAINGQFPAGPDDNGKIKRPKLLRGGLIDVAEEKAQIAVRDDGSLRVSGPVVLLDAEGNPFETKATFSLCRCGHSENKPFCDGSHRRAEFKSAPRA